MNQSNTPFAANELFSRTDAQLIEHAEVLIGSKKLNLSLNEAAQIIRSHYNARWNAGERK